MAKKYNTTITDFHGKINRKSFIAIAIICTIPEIILRVILLPEVDEPHLNLPICYEVLLYMLWCLIVYIKACAIIKRLNDINWSRWNLIIALIPFISIFVIIPCIFKKGIENET